MRVMDIRKQTARAMVELAIEKYSIDKVPRVLLWAQWRREACLVKNWRIPAWLRHASKATKEDMAYHKPHVLQVLSEYSVHAYPVNGKIVDFVGHGKTPDRDDEQRNDRWYRSCVPNAHHPAIGFLVIPAASDEEDHPLVIESLRRRNGSASTSYAHSLGNAIEARDDGLLTAETVAKVTLLARARVIDAITHAERALLETDK